MRSKLIASTLLPRMKKHPLFELSHIIIHNYISLQLIVLNWIILSCAIPFFFNSSFFVRLKSYVEIFLGFMTNFFLAYCEL